MLFRSVDNSNPNPTDTITYTITATNLGAGAATGVIITDLLPSGVTYSSDDSDGDYVPGTGVWTVGIIPPVTPAVLTITATVDSGTEGNIITNSAQLTAVLQTDTDPTNDSDLADLVVSPVNPPNKVSWWRAENNALDSVDGNSGTLVNTVTFATGKVGQAFDFTFDAPTDAQSDVIIVDPVTGFPTSAITTSFWMNTNEAQVGFDGAGIFSYSTPATAGTQSEWVIQLCNPQGVINKIGRAHV